MKVKYPKIQDRVAYHWVSKTTDPTFKDALRVALFDWCNYHVVNVIWLYNKEGW